MASLTKKSVAQLSQDALQAIIRNCAYHAKLLNLLVASLDQKNVQSRVYASLHLKLLLEAQAPAYQQTIAASGGVETLKQAIKKALADANASARENGRSMYYSFAEIWPLQSQALLDGLDANTRKQLDKADPKRAGVGHEPGAGVRSVSGASSAAGRPSLRAMINQKRGAQVSENSSVEPNSVSRPAEGQPADASADRTPVKRPSGIRDSGRPSSMYGRTVSAPRLSATGSLERSPASAQSSPSAAAKARPSAKTPDTTPRTASTSAAPTSIDAAASLTNAASDDAQ